MPTAELLFLRLCLAGPLLYVGLHMAVEPVKFITSLRMLAYVLQNELQNFQHRVGAFRRQEPLYDPNSVVVTRNVQLAVRAAGMALALFSLLFLTGITE